MTLHKIQVGDEDEERKEKSDLTLVCLAKKGRKTDATTRPD